MAGCGGGGGGNSTTSSSDVQQFCELQAQLSKLGQKLTAPLEQRNASPAQFKAAERKIVQSQQFKKLEQAIPSEIKEAGQTAFAAQRSRAGVGPPANQQQEAAAEKQIQQFTTKNCH